MTKSNNNETSIAAKFGKVLTSNVERWWWWWWHFTPLRTTQLSQTVSVAETLKCSLWVTEGHWKWRYSIYHIRLLVCHCKDSSILYHCRVIWRWTYRDLEILVRGHPKSLKMVPFESLGTVFLFAFHNSYGVSLAVSMQYTNVTDTQPDMHLPHDSKSRAMQHRQAVVARK